MTLMVLFDSRVIVEIENDDFKNFTYLLKYLPLKSKFEHYCYFVFIIQKGLLNNHQQIQNVFIFKQAQFRAYEFNYDMCYYTDY